MPMLIFFYSSFPPFSNVLYPVHSLNLTHLSLRKWKCPICGPPTVPGSLHLQPKLPAFPLANVDKFVFSPSEVKANLSDKDLNPISFLWLKDFLRDDKTVYLNLKFSHFTTSFTSTSRNRVYFLMKKKKIHRFSAFWLRSSVKWRKYCEPIFP